MNTQMMMEKGEGETEEEMVTPTIEQLTILDEKVSDDDDDDDDDNDEDDDDDDDDDDDKYEPLTSSIQTEDLKSSGSGSYTSSGYGSQIAMEETAGNIYSRVE